MSEQTVAKTNGELSALLARKLDVAGSDLATVTRRAGRLLPRRLRREAQYLVDLETLANHPKLRSQLDPGRVKRADRRLRAYVRLRDPKKIRMDRFLGRLGSLVFNLLVLAALVISVLAWRGFIGPK